MPEKKVTFADIAAYTGFSKTTVSRYFNNPDSLTLKNQQIIAEALEALNYKQNKLAKVLANGKTEIIGVMVPNLYLHYYAEMLNQILLGYERYGYKFLVFAGNNNPQIERKYFEELQSYNIEGLIVMSHTIPSEELVSYNVPVVTIEREDKCVCSVNTDNYMGAVQATSLLIKTGCEIIVHINNRISPDVPSAKRVSGFLDVCKDKNIPHEFIERSLGVTYEENEKNVAEIVEYIENKYPNKKIGLFMPNDTYANVMLNVLFRKHGTLPKNYGIVGFDNSSISSQSVIPISTVGQQISVIADEAMKLLIMQMDERKKRTPKPLDKPIHKIITPILIRRDTTV